MIGLLEIRRRKLQFTLIAAVFALVAYLVLMITGLGIGLSELAGSARLMWTPTTWPTRTRRAAA
ncbi:MAG: hypothetical protein R3A46_19510 [Thermomicrobiales bacterium]